VVTDVGTQVELARFYAPSDVATALIWYRRAARQALYDGVFDTPKTEASARQIPLSDAACLLVAQWRARTQQVHPESLVFSTRSGTPLAPNNVLRRHIGPACKTVGLRRATWLTFRRTYSSWSHEQGCPARWWRS